MIFNYGFISSFGKLFFCKKGIDKPTTCYIIYCVEKSTSKIYWIGGYYEIQKVFSSDHCCDGVGFFGGCGDEEKSNNSTNSSGKTSSSIVKEALNSEECMEWQLKLTTLSSTKTSELASNMYLNGNTDV